MIMIFPPSCRCIVLLMYETQWKKCIDLVDGERTNSQVLSKLQCLNDVISRRRCSSRAAIFTYLPAGLQFEYVAGAQWFHERICAHWLSDWNCRHRIEDRFSASGKTWSCAAAKEVRLHICDFVQRDPFLSLHWPRFFKGQVSDDIFPLGFCDHSSFAEMRFFDHSFFSKLCSQSSHLKALPVKDTDHSSFPLCLFSKLCS